MADDLVGHGTDEPFAGEVTAVETHHDEVAGAFLRAVEDFQRRNTRHDFGGHGAGVIGQAVSHRLEPLPGAGQPPFVEIGERDHHPHVEADGEDILQHVQQVNGGAGGRAQPARHAHRRQGAFGEVHRHQDPLEADVRRRIGRVHRQIRLLRH